jgi:hypothetical protein
VLCLGSVSLAIFHRGRSNLIIPRNIIGHYVSALVQSLLFRGGLAVVNRPSSLAKLGLSPRYAGSLPVSIARNGVAKELEGAPPADCMLAAEHVDRVEQTIESKMHLSAQ